MKSLPAWHLTDEDRAAWFEWQVSPNRDWLLWDALERLSFAADRRDAQLMLSCARVLPPTRGHESHGAWVILLCAQWWTK